MYVVGQLQSTGHFAFCVVVAVEQVDRDVCLSKPSHLPDKEQTSVEVFPVPVVNVTGDHHEIDLLVDRMRHEVVESVARCSAQALSRRVGIGRQPPQRAVKVQVGGVDEFH